MFQSLNCYYLYYLERVTIVVDVKNTHTIHGYFFHESRNR